MRPTIVTAVTLLLTACALSTPVTAVSSPPSEPVHAENSCPFIDLRGIAITAGSAANVGTGAELLYAVDAPTTLGPTDMPDEPIRCGGVDGGSGADPDHCSGAWPKASPSCVG